MAGRFVVVGGDAAGMSAAAQARRQQPELKIVVFERGEYTSYAACGLPYFVGGEVAGRDSLVARTPEQFRTAGIDVRTRHEVVAVDTDQREVVFRDLDTGSESTQGYDELLIATGGRGVRPPLPGIDAAGVHELRTLPDADRLLADLDGGARRAVVVGAGYIGLEVAEAFVRRGLRTTVLEQAAQPMLTLDPDMADLVSTALTDLGVDLRLGEGLRSFSTENGRLIAAVTDQETVPADVAVIGLGVRPNVELAAAAGCPVGPSGGLVVDERMHTPIDGVWAAGDCVESRHRISGAPTVVALGTHANKQGRVVGTNVAGGHSTFGGVLGTAITRVGALEVARTGLNEAEAAAAGMDAAAVTVNGASRAHYYPGGAPVTVKVVVERATGRLLGAQIAGGEGAGKRIDTFATALWAGLTVDEVAGMDLAYAPPFAPVWDPVLLAAGRAALATALDRTA